MCICSIMHFITSCFYDLSKIIKTTMKKQTEKIWRDYKLNTVSVWGDRFHIRSVVCIGNITRIFIECFSYAMWHFTWYFLISSWMPWFACSLHNSARWCWIQLTFLLCRWLEFRGCSWRVQILSLMLLHCMTLSKSHHLFEPQFSPIKWGKWPMF